MRIMTIFMMVLLVFSSMAIAAEQATSPIKGDEVKAVEQEAMNESIRLQKLFYEHPEIILDVLKQHGDFFLDLVQKTSMERRAKALEAQWRESMKEPKNIDIKGYAARGKADTPVVIVGYSDFLCGYCRQSVKLLQHLLEKYSNDVRYVFKPLVLHEKQPVAKSAALYYLAAMEQGADKAYALHDEFYANMEKLYKDGDKYLKEAVGKVGLDAAKLEKAVASEKVQKMYDVCQKEGERLGVSGTPTFIINDIKTQGIMPPEMMYRAIEMALEAKKANAPDNAAKK